MRIIRVFDPPPFGGAGSPAIGVGPPAGSGGGSGLSTACLPVGMGGVGLPAEEAGVFG